MLRYLPPSHPTLGPPAPTDPAYVSTQIYDAEEPTPLFSGLGAFFQRLFTRTADDTKPPSSLPIDKCHSVPESTTHERSLQPTLPTDLTGHWKPVIDADFCRRYDQYMQACGTSGWVRQVIRGFLSQVSEEFIQEASGDLTVIGHNPVGVWKRTLVSSLSWDPTVTVVKDAESDPVEIEAWWEGDRHRSILRNKPRVGGGEFETIRYLHADRLVVESYFHPAAESPDFAPAHVTWQFQRIA